MPPVITSAANPVVRAARKLGRRHGRARTDDSFLVEGPQAVAEAIPFLRQLFVTPEQAQRREELVTAARDAGVQIVTVTGEVLDDIATTVHPQGLTGVAVLHAVPLDEAVDRARLVVLLHQVRDPGNAGTAIRTADAAGADAVVLTRGSVDPRNPKVVRSSAGSLFHLPVVADVAAADALASCRHAGLGLVAAAADGPLTHSDADLSGGVCLVFGNEAHGLDAHVRRACDSVVRIPLQRPARPGYQGGAESLNLAATVAVLTFEAARQQRVPQSGKAPDPRGTR